MGTYVVSDIHGQLDCFKELLDKVNFKYGEDSLHILGDMVDWGDKSVETLLFVMDLVNKHKNIHVYKGNHEDILYKYVKKLGVTRELLDTDWAILNGGEVTIDKLLTLPKKQVKSIIKFIGNLRYFESDLVIGDNKYYLAHSFPFIQYNYDKKTYSNPYEQSLWRRLKGHENPFNEMCTEDREYYKDHIFVYGHTIVNKYKLIEKDDSATIYKDYNNRKICIDCGGKLLGKGDGNGGKFRLGILRLEDMSEEYVG